MSKSENTMHDANRKGWDAVSAKWQANIDARMDWRRVPENIRLVLDEEELGYLGDVSGRSACVLGSGDNLVAFALAGAGAKVTSVDISGTQLDVAAERAKEIGLSIQFHRADVTDLHELRDDAFDLVYTGGHVAVWVSDHGPFEYDRSEDLPDGASGPLPSYEFHWTIADMTCAMLDGGFELLALREYGDESQGWEGGAPLERMPSNLLLVGRKKPGKLAQ